MPSVAVTRLRLRSRRFIPEFYYYTWAIVRQARRSPGFIKGQLFMGTDRFPPVGILYGRQPGYWTMTMWEDQDAMLAFRDQPPHRDAMPKSAKWVQEASTVHWRQKTDELPTLDTAHDRMLEGGRLMASNHPSEAHASGRVPEEPGLEPFVSFHPAGRH